MPERRYANQSVTRAFDVLRCFDQARKPLTVTAIAEMTGFPLPTAFRFVRALESEGILDRLDSGAYRPSLALLRLGFATLDSMDLVRFADPRLRALADATMETVNLGVLDRADVRYLIRVRNADLVTADIRVGSLLPSASTSMGKLLLAYLDESDLQDRLARLDFETARGRKAIRSGADLLVELQRIRERGWAYQDEELEYGLRSIAAPVLNHHGKVIAAINVAVPAARWTIDELAERFLSRLLECGAQISRDVGYNGPIDHDTLLRSRVGGQHTTEEKGDTHVRDGIGGTGE
ncbi:IclR family transcriptional regulator [Agromyces aerolatus]|uniref:IclR family transcriptional regulator n=1 Tax=Agromyces sp. LY-1074 TaxID=3074080 RepID=UPI00286205B2|nr:IclR family transcriptional regulator [Agromyces sp. LY-1074]MDR5700843.1 IclR family transcriptional regulator [Agromyces sp. LY-1074]